MSPVTVRGWIFALLLYHCQDLLLILVSHQISNWSFPLCLQGQTAQTQNVNLVLLARFPLRNPTTPPAHPIPCEPAFCPTAALTVQGFLAFLTSLFVSCSCKSVAVPGNSRNDTVCSDSGTATVLPHTILNLLLTQSSASHKAEVITRPVTLNSAPALSYITGEL